MQGKKNVRVPNKMSFDLYLTFIFIYGTQYHPVFIFHYNRPFQQPTKVSATSISIRLYDGCNATVMIYLFYWIMFGELQKLYYEMDLLCVFFLPSIHCETHSTSNSHIFFDFNYNSLDCISLLAMEPHRTHRHAVWLAKVKLEWNRKVAFNNIQFKKKKLKLLFQIGMEINCIEILFMVFFCSSFTHSLVHFHLIVYSCKSIILGNQIKRIIHVLSHILFLTLARLFWF